MEIAENSIQFVSLSRDAGEAGRIDFEHGDLLGFLLDMATLLAASPKHGVQPIP
jgi:hypothetical protein